MTPVNEIINTYEVSVSQLRDQQKTSIPTLALYGDDCQFMDVPYIIEAINDIKPSLPADCSDLAARIATDLAKLHEMIADHNSLIKEGNDILDDHISNLRESLEVQLSDIPEVQLKRAVVIRTNHMNEAEISVLDKVYDKLNITHLSREERKDVVYFNEETTPNLRKSIITEFSLLLMETHTDSSLKFENYVQTEAVMGFTSELIKVIKSKR